MQKTIEILKKEPAIEYAVATAEGTLHQMGETVQKVGGVAKEVAKDLANAPKKELFKFLVENKQTLIAQKKAIIKEGDNVPFINIAGNNVGVNKAAGNNDSIQVLAAINTTNLALTYSYIADIMNPTCGFNAVTYA